MVVDFHHGYDLEPISGGHLHVLADNATREIGVAFSQRTEEISTTIVAYLTPDEAVRFAVEILRERNLLVTSSG